jgi:hypothetical protein
MGYEHLRNFDGGLTGRLTVNIVCRLERRVCHFQGRKERLLVERKQTLQTVEDDLALGGRDNGFLCRNIRNASDCRSRGCHVDIDQLLQELDIGALGSKNAQKLEGSLDFIGKKTTLT